jgi:methanesulfonate monooxygenase small subunit
MGRIKMSSNGTDKAVSELIYRSCLLLDEMDFEGFLNLCDSKFRYKVTVYSPEILKHMTWQEVDKAEMKRHLELVPKHVSNPSPLSRRATVYTISYDDKKKVADAVSGFEVYQTTLDGGSTALLGIGKYYDTVNLASKDAKLLSRNVKLETRQLGMGSQLPL